MKPTSEQFSDAVCVMIHQIEAGQLLAELIKDRCGSDADSGFVGLPTAFGNIFDSIRSQWEIVSEFVVYPD